MICLDNYSLIYEKKKNRIVICLPQTTESILNTTTPIVNRRFDVKNEELLGILVATKLTFENKET